MSGSVLAQATVEFKWAHWCRNLLWVQLALYLLWVFAFTLFTILFQVSQLLPLNVFPGLCFLLPTLQRCLCEPGLCENFEGLLNGLVIPPQYEANEGCVGRVYIAEVGSLSSIVLQA